MPVQIERLQLKTSGDGDVIDLTRSVEGIIRASNIRDGTVTVFVPGSTASITTVEYEPGLIEDIRRAFEQLVPQHARYAHNHGGDSNGHAHVRAAIVGPGITLPIESGSMTLGTWQQIVLIDFDDRARSREVVVQINGEA